MRVLFDHQTFSYQRFGGNSRYFAELMTVFYRQGEPMFDLGVATTPNEYLRGAPFYRGAYSDRVDVTSFFARYLRNAIATRIAARQPHDILHTTFYDPGALAAQRGAKRLDRRQEGVPRQGDMALYAGSVGRGGGSRNRRGGLVAGSAKRVHSED